MNSTNNQETPNNQSHHDKPNQWILPLILIAGIVVILIYFSAQPIVDRAIEIPFEENLEIFVGYAILLAEIAAMLIVTVSVLEALFNFFKGLLNRKQTRRVRSSETLRLRLGHRLALALEFALASDILRIAISPSLSDLMFLQVIILLRFLLNFFLEDEAETIKATAVYPDLEPCDSDDLE
ncbi:MAG: DUF1622 domain-containing protein [Anaerolineaceae bacterium]|nr:DUF1622 domain-containing protein [Anaerolineaceae bacterium]